MIASSQIRAVLLLLAATAAAPAQTTPQGKTGPAPHKAKSHKAFQPAYNPNVIVLDPAHGGSDDGAKLDANTFEKDFDLTFANRLKTLLEARGFSVVLTHTSAEDTLTGDQRVEIANRARAVACLLLHATAAGQGIHLFTSSLTAPYFADASLSEVVVPWDTAQAASLPRSLQLANELSTALNGLREPLLVGRSSVRPIDSMSCPAVAVELAPAAPGKTLSDDDYLEHVAESIVTALTYWRQHAQAQIGSQMAAAQAASDTLAPASSAAAPVPKPKPKPKPVVIVSPDESPLAPDSSTPKPAPIERKPPPAAVPAIPPTDTPPAGGAR